MFKGGGKMKLRKIVEFLFIVVMFLIVVRLDTVENTNANDISSAKMQSQLNRESRWR